MSAKHASARTIRENKILKYDNQKLPYYSKRLTAKRYPEGGYVVVGAVGSGLKKPIGTVQLEGKEVLVYTNHYNKITHGIDGYIDCGNNRFLAVVKRAKWRWLLLLLLAALLALGALWLHQQQDDITPEPTVGTDPTMDTDALPYEPSNITNQVVDENYIALPGYSEVSMAADTNYMQIALWNPSANTCLFRFSILMDDEVLYESGLVEPGYAVQEQYLSRSIAEGTYDAVIKIQCYDLEDTTAELNGGEINIKVIAVG